MKYCRECGIMLSDDAAFCDGCGAQQGTVRQSEPASDFAVVETVKDIAKSPFFLVVCALLTVVTLFSLLTSGLVITGAFLIRGLAVFLIPAVIAGCLWCVYVSAKKDTINVKPMKVIKVIHIVVMILLIAYMVLAFVSALIADALFSGIADIFFGGSNATINDANVAGAALVVMLIMLPFALVSYMSEAIIIFTAIAIPVLLIYFISMNKTLKSICSTASKGVVTTKISIVSAVVSILMGATIIFGGISLIDFMKPTYLIFRQILMFGVYGSLFILLGAFLFYCRRKLALLSK